MKTIKDYIQGEHFVYGKKNCVVLEHMDDGTLCMVLDEDFKSEFGETNNFAESELRKKLNGEYLDKWVKSGANRESFMLMQVDLTANDGLKDYGTCECFLAPRTCDQHRKYRYLIPSPKTDWEWEATAYSTKENGYSNFAYEVRPLFKLNPDAIIVPDTDFLTIPIKTTEPQMPNRAEPCEHEFEALYYCLDLVNSVGTSSVYVCLGEEYKPKRLVYCKKCGQVFVKEFEEEGK